MLASRRRNAWCRRAVCAGTALLALACKDAPTAPEVIRQAAGGSLWAAIAVPAGVPQAETWLPYVQPKDSGGRQSLDEIQQIGRAARAARRTGDVGLALRLEADASRRAAEAVNVAPPPGVLLDALSGLQLWADHAEWEFGDGAEVPWVNSASTVVRRHGGDARAALLRGDTAAAVLLLDAGAETVRAHSPEAVAVRVLDDADHLLAAVTLSPPMQRRAERLLRTARAGLAAGDGGRALHRALYALQLAGGMRADSTARGRAP